MAAVAISLGCVAGAALSYAVGANDVSNSMGTSVGSGALTKRGALVIASIFEFAGVMLIGRLVSDTIRFSIVDPAQHGDSPFLFMLGMLAVLIASFMWLIVATLMAWPVSTTHTIVAGVVGFGLVENGIGGVNQQTMLNILISWIASPLLGVVMGFLVQLFLTVTIINTPNGRRNNEFVFPLMAGLTAATGIAFLLLGISKALKNPNFPFWLAIVVGVAAGVVAVPLIKFALWPWWRINGASYQKWTQYVTPVGEMDVQQQQPYLSKPDMSGSESTDVDGVDDLMAAGSPKQSSDSGAVDTATLLQRQELTSLERPYVSLMVFTAALVAFGHGSNDIANSVGPFSVVLEWALTGQVGDPTWEIPLWVFVVAGAFLVIGLATLGDKVMETVGKKITKLSFTSGFAAQYATAFVVVGATLLGLPISTTHTIVGAVTGTALVTTKGRAAVGWRELLWIVLSWALTIGIGLGLTIILYLALKAMYNV